MPRKRKASRQFAKPRIGNNPLRPWPATYSLAQEATMRASEKQLAAELKLIESVHTKQEFWQRLAVETALRHELDRRRRLSFLSELDNDISALARKVTLAGEGFNSKPN